MTNPVLRKQITPLSPKQGEQLEALARTLTPEQALWASGYLAGVAARPLSGEVGAGLPAAEAGAAAKVTVLYASETGNAAELARRIGAMAQEQGLDATVADTAEYSVRDLKKVKRVVVVSSTHGEGDPPDPATTFFEELHSKKAPKLDGVEFAVLALGDSTYEHYCEAGKVLDRRFEELGGQRIHDRVDCDVDYEDDAEAWINAVLEKLSAAARAEGEAAAVAEPAGGAVIRAFPGAEPAAVSQYDKRNPFPAPVIDSLDLTGRGSSKRIRHVELSLEGSGLTYLPGDSLGIVPRNDPALVAEVIETLGLDADEAVTVKDTEMPLVEALGRHYEITVLTPKFIEAWAQLSGADSLKRLTNEDNRGERQAFMAANHVLDVIRDYPVSGLDAGNLLAALRRLQPRLYSLASSLAAMPDEAHLTVSLLRYELNGRDRFGVASSQLCDRAPIDETLPVYVQANPNFRLPADGDRPIIMVGAGTGVAPYRAFLQERKERGDSGRSWLVFGERHFRTDFLYQVEWQRYLKDGVLNRMSVAFSREQAEKVYVQDRIREAGKDIYAWLEEGAHFYVCGDAEGMAPAVHAALEEAVARKGGLTEEKAAEYVRNLQREDRYQRDVY